MRFLTETIPGTGGILKDVPEDFVVAEIPSYLPCGEGEHVFAEIEKRGLTTFEAIRRIAGVLKVKERDVGYAGLKDARGVTRQTLSIPRVDPERLLALQLSGITVLSARRHRNKLKPGHLTGNRFRITIKGAAGDGADNARRVLDVLTRRGVPNYFGEQRYGSQGNSHLIGGAMLRGDYRGAVDALIGDPAAIRDAGWREAVEAYRRGDLEASARLFPGHCRTERDVIRRLLDRPDQYEKALHAVHPRLKALYLSAWQSALFDLLLDRRLESFDTVLAGDLAWRHANGACFLVEDVPAEQVRAERFEISPSGPLFGSRMSKPTGAPLEHEAQVLREQGVEAALLEGTGERMEGGRRPLRVPLANPVLDRIGEDLVVEFSLPRGAYATSVLREIMKT